MNKLLCNLVAGVTLAVAQAVALAGTAALHLEESPNFTQWTPLPLNQLTLTPGGAALINTTGTPKYYRLRIEDAGGTGSMNVMRLEDAPAQSVEQARQHLVEFLRVETEGDSDSEKGWDADTELAPVCYPVYDPAHEGGRKPAYIEFKVVSKPRTTEPGTPLGLTAPDESDAGCDRGYILVSLTRADFPIAAFAENGPTRVETLLRRTGGRGSVRAMRFEESILVAEDERGRPVGSLGSAPIRVDPRILEIAGREFGLDIPERGDPEGDAGPSFELSPIQDYEAWKKEVVDSPLHQRIRAERTEAARRRWFIADGGDLKRVQVAVRESTIQLAGAGVVAVTVDDPSVVRADVDTASGGVKITGLANGGTVVTATLADGKLDYCLVFSGSNPNAGFSPRGVGSWTSWAESYAGNWADQRRYQQVSNDPNLCPSAASGCGPTAWAMLYGWWDRKGSPRSLASLNSADSPLNNTSSVIDCYYYIFPRVGTFCVGGQAATPPWSMQDGYKWGDSRGVGRSLSMQWGVPYLSPGSRNRARDSVKAGRPSIIGIGVYSHYPLAYGYRYREYRAFGIVWDTERQFKCNMGWGGSSPEWVGGSSVWFATNGRFW